jgi:hypothetical protein
MKFYLDEKLRGNNMMFRGKRKPAIYNLHQLPMTARLGNLSDLALWLNQSTIYLSTTDSGYENINFQKKFNK